MSGHVRWRDIRDEHVRRAGGEEAVEAGKQELMAEVIGVGGSRVPPYGTTAQRSASSVATSGERTLHQPRPFA